MYDKTLLEKSLEHFNVKVNDNMMDKFIKYYDLLIEWNKKINLTAITEFEEVVNKHFTDSLALVKVVELNNKASLIDIGTGAGFPGIPLKIVYHELDIVLLDSLNKRVTFLDEVITQLNLKDIKSIHGRAEDYGRDKNYRDRFDISVSRAVAGLNVLCEYCMPLVKIGGVFVSYKSGNIDDELENSKKAIKTMSGELKNIEKFNIPFTDIERSLVVVKKISKTSSIYPRQAGKPTKEPII